MEKQKGRGYDDLTRETEAVRLGAAGTLRKESTMREYKQIKCSQREAEQIMNDMAERGWRVVSVTYWAYWWVHLLITFERDK